MLATTITLSLVALLLREWASVRERATERTAWIHTLTAERHESRRELDRILRDHRDQVQTLLNQIKPDTAQPVIPLDAPTPQPVSEFSDDEYWESKEDLAERIMAQEMNSHGR